MWDRAQPWNVLVLVLTRRPLGTRKVGCAWQQRCGDHPNNVIARLRLYLSGA
jgi:hypothetical protein